jgi:hypothetical protein
MQLMKVLRWIVGAALAGAVACASTQEPVVLVSISPADLSRLGGEWAGSYSSPVTGRSGSIAFHLTAADSAHVDVIMIPSATGVPLQRAMNPAQPVRPTEPRDLTIRFVRFEGDRVTGRMNPYTDPDCSCPVLITFEGTVRGNRIEGTFTTRGAPSGAAVTGTWSVERRP